MPWNGSGSFDLLHDFNADKAAGPPDDYILASRMMEQLEDIAQAIQACVARNGETAVSGNIPMGGYRLTGMAAASAPTHPPLLSQITEQTVFRPSSYAGSATAWTITLPFAPSAYLTGFKVRGIIPYTNTGAVTVAINALSAKSVKYPGNTDPASGDLEAGLPFEFIYDGTNFIINRGFLEPTSGSVAANEVSFSPTGTVSSTTVQAAIAEVSGDVTSLTSTVGAIDTDVDDHETRIDSLEASIALKANLSSANFTALQQGGSNVLTAAGGYFNTSNDGVGSGLDADLLDGVQGSGYGRATVVQSLGTVTTTQSPDYASGQIIDMTLGGNITINVPSNAVAGDVVVFRLRQDATGGRTVTWASGFKFASATAPTLSTSASKIDRIVGLYRDANTIEMGPLLKQIE